MVRDNNHEGYDIMITSDTATITDDRPPNATVCPDIEQLYTHDDDFLHYLYDLLRNIIIVQ